MEIMPEWLETWLNLPFYEGEKCRIHAKHYNTVYCVTCMAAPFCDFCWRDSDQHDGDHHQILHVRRASERASIEVDDIKKFIDVSEIQLYIINKKIIVFLNPHVQGAPDTSQKPYCHTCQRRLIKSDEFKEYKFCCVACKVQNKRRDTEIENNGDEQEQAMINRAGSRKLEANMIISDECFFISMRKGSGKGNSMRKGSRKGIPCRAPLQ